MNDVTMWMIILIIVGISVLCIAWLWADIKRLKRENEALSLEAFASADELKRLKEFSSPSVITVEQIDVPVEYVHAVLETPGGVKLTDAEVNMKLATKLAEQMLMAGVVDIRSEYDFKTMKYHIKARVRVAKKVDREI